MVTPAADWYGKLPLRPPARFVDVLALVMVPTSVFVATFQVRLALELNIPPAPANTTLVAVNALS